MKNDWLEFGKASVFRNSETRIVEIPGNGNKSSASNSFSIVHAQKHGVKYPKTINKVSKLNGYTLKPFNSILKMKIKKKKWNNEYKNHSRNAIRMLPTLCK